MANKQCILASKAAGKLSILTITNGVVLASSLQCETGASARVNRIVWLDNVIRFILFFTVTSILLTACGPVRRPVIRQTEAVKKVLPIPKSWYVGKLARPGLLAVAGSPIENRDKHQAYIVYVNSKKSHVSYRPQASFFVPGKTRGQNAPLAPNGRWLVYIDKRKNATVLDIETGRERTLIQPRKAWRLGRFTWTSVSRLFVMAEKTGKSGSRTQVFSVNPLTGKLGPVVIESSVPIEEWSRSEPMFWQISLLSGKRWVAAYFGGGILRVADLKRHKQFSLKLNKHPSSAPALSPNGQAVAYEEGNAIWLRDIEGRSKPKRILKTRPKRDLKVVGFVADSNTITWPDSRHLLIVDTNRGSADTTITVSAYRIDRGTLSLMSRFTAGVPGINEEDDELPLRYGGFLEPPPPLGDLYPTSPDGKGIVVGVDARSFREGRSKLLIYSYKKKGFLKIDLNKKIVTVDTLGWAKEW